MLALSTTTVQASQTHLYAFLLWKNVWLPIIIGYNPRSLTIRAIAEDGSTLGLPANVNLAVGEFLQRDAGELFALGPNTSPPAASGSIRVEADGSGIIGDIIFGDSSSFNYAAAVPLQTLTFTKAVFSQVANTASLLVWLCIIPAHPRRS